MIFYFSGTGNSYWAAKEIADIQQERLYAIADEMGKRDNSFLYKLEKGERIGFVFPIYAWAPPKMVLDFVEKLSFTGYDQNYTFALCTCGAEAGNGMDIFRKALRKKKLSLDSAFSLQMPDNCVVLFDVDSPSEEKEKLEHSQRQILTINKIIAGRIKGEYHVKKGSMKGLKSGLIAPLFQTMFIRPEKFFATDRCIGCGLCETVCPSKIIKVDRKPYWNTKGCTFCLACINRCPVEAIQYGKSTQGRGRYVNPILK